MGVGSRLGSSGGVGDGSRQVRQGVSALIRPRQEKREEKWFLSSFINSNRQTSSLYIHLYIRIVI